LPLLDKSANIHKVTGCRQKQKIPHKKQEKGTST